MMDLEISIEEKRNELAELREKKSSKIPTILLIG